MIDYCVRPDNVKCMNISSGTQASDLMLYNVVFSGGGAAQKVMTE